MNLRHGFFSEQVTVNPDSRMINTTSQTPSIGELVAAEKYLHGDDCSNPIAAHLVVKNIWAAGTRKYPTLWALADRYVRSPEYPTMDKLASLAAA